MRYSRYKLIVFVLTSDGVRQISADLGFVAVTLRLGDRISYRYEESVLTPGRPTSHLPAETARWSTITQIYEGTNQIQRVVMARQLLK